MDIKGRLTQTLINLRSMEVKGQDNVMILAQTFLDLNEVLKQLDEEDEKNVQDVKEKTDKK